MTTVSFAPSHERPLALCAVGGCELPGAVRVDRERPRCLAHAAELVGAVPRVRGAGIRRHVPDLDLSDVGRGLE